MWGAARKACVVLVSATVVAGVGAPSALGFGQVPGSPFAIPATWLRFLPGERMEAVDGNGSAVSAVEIDPITGKLTVDGTGSIDTSGEFFPDRINPAGTM